MLWQERAKREAQAAGIESQQVRKTTDAVPHPYVVHQIPLGRDLDCVLDERDDARQAFRPYLDFDKFAGELGIPREVVHLYSVCVRAAQPAAPQLRGPQGYQVVRLPSLNVFDVLGIPRPVGGVTTHGPERHHIAPRQPTTDERREAAQRIERGTAVLLEQGVLRESGLGFHWVYAPASLFGL